MSVTSEAGLPGLAQRDFQDRLSRRRGKIRISSVVGARKMEPLLSLSLVWV